MNLADEEDGAVEVDSLITHHAPHSWGFLFVG